MDFTYNLANLGAGLRGFPCFGKTVPAQPPSNTVCSRLPLGLSSLSVESRSYALSVRWLHPCRLFGSVWQDLRVPRLVRPHPPPEAHPGQVHPRRADGAPPPPPRAAP